MGQIRAECSGCAQFQPSTNGCLRLAHGMPCVLTEAAAHATLQSAFEKQVAGSHYSGLKHSPAKFIQENGLGFLEGCVIKRMCRWKNKDGLQALRKAIHEIELLIAMEESAR